MDPDRLDMRARVHKMHVVIELPQAYQGCCGIDVKAGVRSLGFFTSEGDSRLPRVIFQIKTDESIGGL